MQLKKGSTKKLKTINSQNTETTLSENCQSQIKISIKSPQELKQKIAEQSLVQIIGIPQQDQTIRLQSGNTKKLLNVPLVIGKKENSLFNTQNFEAMLQSANEDNMRMMIRNTEANQGNSSRDINETSLLMILNQSIKQSKYKLQVEQKTSQTHKKQKKQDLNLPYNIKQTSSGLVHEKQDNKKKIRRVNSDFQVLNQKYQSINNQQRFYQKKNTIIEAQLGKKVYETAIPEISLWDKEKIKKTSIKVTQAENEKQKRSSNSRLKLREYMFKTQVSSVKALLQKKQKKHEKQHKEVGQKKGMQTQRKKVISKYSMTNQKLCYVLKEEIESQLDGGIMYINTLKKILRQTELKPDTSNQELAKIFSIRKVIKEEVNQKLGNLIQKVTKNQGSNKPKITTGSNKNTEKMIHI